MSQGLKETLFNLARNPLVVSRMSGKKLVYLLAVIVASLGMFLPLLYGAVPFVRELLGSDPLPKSLVLMLLGWAVAYFTYEEEKEGFTAS